VLGDGYECLSCCKKYPLHDGIPDFRVFPDPFLSFQEDNERTNIVLAALEKFNLEKWDNKEKKLSIQKLRRIFMIVYCPPLRQNGLVESILSKMRIYINEKTTMDI
jgi:5-methylthioribose kinase